MTDDEALRRLSELAGIKPGYWDIRGRRHETTPETARAILAAQAIPAHSPAEVAASLAGLEEEPWHEILPPVVVAREGTPAAFALHLPAGLAGRSLAWNIHLEDGSRRPGTCDLSAMPLSGKRQIDGRPVERRTIPLPALPCGYHRLELSGAAGDVATTLIVAPAQAYLPPAMAAGGRVWGIAAQLYALRSGRNPGMGEFSDLADLLVWAGEQGADAVGVNPLHALFPRNPAHASPYSPNSRRFLNPLYLDVTAIADFIESDAARAAWHSRESTARLAAARAADLVDYDAVAAIKRPVFDALYANFRDRHRDRPGDSRAQACRDFVAGGGLALERFALHAALCEAFGTQDWSVWPAPYHDPASQACAEFAREHGERIGFHLYLQWQCDRQLGDAAARSAAAGLNIGIYGDLAVSTSPDGADVWGAQDIFSAGARVGAPPDPFNEAGQEWGVVPMNPTRMRKTGYADFIALLRANMRHFGALRIDHAMELARLFWIPRGAPTSSGAYVGYPLDDLLAIVALESRRNQCLVIGEDLGTVPDGFRERLAETRILSYRVLYFEQQDGRFKPPQDYPALAAACVSTHDLPTLKGFWEESDLDDRLRAGVLPSQDEFLAARDARRADKRALLDVLASQELLPQGIDRDAREDVALTPALAAAIHRFLARAEAGLFMVQIDDLAGEHTQANMPGTTGSYPNWRRRLHVPLTALAQSEASTAILRAVRAERPRKSGRPPDSKAL